MFSQAMKNRRESIRSLMVLKHLIRKLQLVRSLMAPRRLTNISDGDSREKSEVGTIVPKDVRKGHFAVVAVQGNGEPKRFVLELNYLSNPAFLRLLELAKEEYGFQQRGVLVLPCQPEELEKILDDE
ncbi:hypothetical protein K2173_002015 [Erythroxylum novogranatense]|uniref:Small auxin up regulated protein n=1 Tax=Erythroxylum novogranatense TaxID=1862640 RepID=A0AAV8SP83_9ROSI|nr:hypothetical protein K2173_002015 [Erythroxylum novogranatense]